MDAINETDHDAARIHRRMNLSFSFAGSDRQMSQLYQNIMDIAGTYATMKEIGVDGSVFIFHLNKNAHINVE